MRISGFNWSGVRTNHFEDTIRFFSNDMQLPLNFRDDSRQVAIFCPNPNQVFEIVGPNYEHFERHEFPAIGFEVDDIRSARQELEQAGTKFISEFTEAEDGTTWTHFRGPDGILYGLIAHGRREDSL